MDLPATSDLGDYAAFSGGPAPGAGGGLGTIPSRMLMQQLYDAGAQGDVLSPLTPGFAVSRPFPILPKSSVTAGMLDSLPEDVRAMLQRRGPPKGLSASPIDLALEARDPRMASDVVFQFLAFRQEGYILTSGVILPDYLHAASF